MPTNTAKPISELVAVLATERDRLQQLLLGAERRVGTRTGFSRLDTLLGDGLQPGHLVLLASRPGHGKSALALQIAATAGLHDRKNVAFFSPEATELELVQRLWANSAHVDGSRLRAASLEEDEWPRAHKGYAELRASKVRIDDTAGQDVEYVCDRVRRFRGNAAIALAVIDSLQGLDAAGEPGSAREQLPLLKRLARELRIPVVATVRLPGRAFTDEAGEDTLLGDLREVGAGELEQEADVVMLLDLEPALNPASERYGEADLYVTKNRGGPTGCVDLCFLYQRGSFAGLARAVPKSVA